MENHRFFLKYVFLKMGTSPKSSFFQRLARGLRPKNGVVQRETQTGSQIAAAHERDDLGSS